MKILGFLAIALALLSIVSSMWIAVDSPARCAQAVRLDFPLDLQEATLAMILPICLASLALLGGLITVQRWQGRIAVATASASWLLIWLILGNAGFRYLF